MALQLNFAPATYYRTLPLRDNCSWYWWQATRHSSPILLGNNYPGANISYQMLTGRKKGSCYLIVNKSAADLVLHT